MEAERILNEYEAWRLARLESPVDVSVSAYLSDLRTEAVGDVCSELYDFLTSEWNDEPLGQPTVDKWLTTLKDAGFGAP